MNSLLKVSHLRVYFPVGKTSMFGRTTGYTKAVDGVSFEIRRGETFGVVGESGSGKTTLGRAVLRAIEPTGGEIIYHRDGNTIDIMGLKRNSLREMWRHMQMIFQDPYSSLNPRMTVRDVLSEPLIANKLSKGAELNDRVVDIVRRCGLDVEHLSRYPHAFSGGQRQRIAIARALVLRPEFIVCDEPVSALDVAIQAQIINLLRKLQAELGLTYLFISHDLGVVQYICDDIAVMYLGKVVEMGDRISLFKGPLHPYTWALLSAVPSADPALRDRTDQIRLQGDPPSPIDPPPGCGFASRCPFAQALCTKEAPPLRSIRTSHSVACHLVSDNGVPPQRQI